MKKSVNIPLQETRLVWIDLEMTGLNPDHDVILEIATVVTDAQGAIIAEAPVFVLHHEQQVLDCMDAVVRAMHTQSGLIADVLKSDTTLEYAYNQVQQFLQKHIPLGTRALLAGNSVWNDRVFLHRYMPSILALLAYRIIDVSTLKELIAQWYPHARPFFKNKGHRARADIYESIAELQYYKTHYFT